MPSGSCCDADWIDWRAERLNQFARRLYAEVKRAKPEVIVSAAPSIYPWSKTNYLQDWPTWVNEGYVDQVCPQVYRDNIASYRRELIKLAEQVDPEQRHKLVPGMLVRTADGYRTSDEMVRKMIAANREQGYAGEVIFYHEALRHHAEVLRECYQQGPQR